MTHIELLSEERCMEIIDSVGEAEDRYLNQLETYKTKHAEAEAKQAANPKQKVKFPKEPFAPQHAYTSLARAHLHLKAQRAKNELVTCTNRERRVELVTFLVKNKLLDAFEYIALSTNFCR